MTHTDTSTTGEAPAAAGEVEGWAPPNTGLGESGQSEIPIGVDALDPEKTAAAREQAQAAGDALDVAEIAAATDDASAPTAGAVGEAASPTAAPAALATDDDEVATAREA